MDSPRLTLPVSPTAQAAGGIIDRLRAHGHQAFFVGGCVRDLLLGRDPQDYDIATSALPAEIEALFPRTVPVGRKFGVLLVVEGGRGFQVATFRSESGYLDGRHPDEIAFTDVQTDAGRRDFTVNGLYYDPASQQVLDWVGGVEDLRNQVIRTIGTPADRFGEDHLRLLRAVRFAAQLSFSIHPSTYAALREGVHAIADVSADRIREELIRLFRPPHADRGLQLLRESGILEILLPEVEAMSRCDQSPNFHAEGTVFEHIHRMLAQLPSDASDELVWSVLLHDVGKPLTADRRSETGTIHFYGHERVGATLSEAILRRLRFPRRDMETIVTAVAQHMQFKDVPHMRPATVRRMMLRPTFELELELHRLDCLGSHGNLSIHAFLQAERCRLRSTPALLPPLLTGKDLLAFGLSPGPRVGSLLDQARELQLQGALRTREEALAWALDQLNRTGRSAPPTTA